MIWHLGSRTAERKGETGRDKGWERMLVSATMPIGQARGSAECWRRRLAYREGILLFLCVFSDGAPRTLLSRFFRAHGPLWGAVFDNVSHACVSAASWSVVMSLSYPPPTAGENCLFVALPGSPLHLCYSSSLARIIKPPQIRWQPLPTTEPSEPSQDGSRADLGLLRSLPPRVCPRTGRPAAAAAGAGRRAHPASRPSAVVVAEVVLAACAGSALDVDHFLAAGSLRLSGATSLSGRPWGHCVAALFVVALAMAALTHNARAGSLIFTAGASHQLRDATRRGLWLYPPGGPKTPPLGYPMYLLVQALLPLLVAQCLRCGASPRCRPCVGGETRWLRRRPRHHARRHGGHLVGSAGMNVEWSQDEEGRTCLP